MLIVANEFLDALPVRQLVRTGSGLARAHGGPCGRGAVCRWPEINRWKLPYRGALAAAPEGAILETSPAAATVVQEVAARLVAHGGAALFIDYGHAVSQRRRHAAGCARTPQGRRVCMRRRSGSDGACQTLPHWCQSRRRKVHAGWAPRATRCVVAGLGIAARRAGTWQRTSPQAEGDIRRRRAAPYSPGRNGHAVHGHGALAAPGWPDGAGFCTSPPKGALQHSPLQRDCPRVAKVSQNSPNILYWDRFTRLYRRGKCLLAKPRNCVYQARPLEAGNRA